MRRIYDISLPVATGGVTYPGSPEIRIWHEQAIAHGDAANVSALSFGSHTATHVDAPRHFIDGGRAVDELALERLIGPALVCEFADHVMAIGEAELRKHDLGDRRRVLLKTRNSALLGSREFVPDFTYLAPDGAEYLVRRGVELVGIDYLSIERFGADAPRTHRALLERDIVIVEGLDLRRIPPGEYELICLPLKLAGLDGAPARAVLVG